VHWKLQGVSYIVSKFHEFWTWSISGLKLDQRFYPPSVNSALTGFADEDQQTKLNQTLPKR